ncbi:DUF2157 domain-containing protein [Mucilaginibacter polytrichastri]|uniref:DUF2157 domain-containing protein n=1 Tax=Mucilaginibacter polytrichastri TaxID=1302689 RepID=A0A1Q6A5G4_9SPHI|nr:DUF2157 domain-containing protein [Mucilaginibacter polytrichastri]OKS89249.1 hypothetical protein RG47T_4733 [Mucilaginibacter polytrichastri]SFS75611.1 Predicted membrane protein [Mucilaginibacter polytrichastri]
MPDNSTFETLHADGLISDESFEKNKEQNANSLFSIHWEVKTLLYVGILLLTSGLGIFVYKNIDTIGHQAILAFIALISTGCFAYCLRHKKPFNRARVQTENAFFDYILLLGTLTLVTFIGYLQYQYNVFGGNYGMATFVPMLLLFYIAYYFDHVGILNMAIVNLGLWMGVSVTPKQLLFAHTFNSETIIFTYLGFGLLLLLAAWLTQWFIFKKHFKFSYQHYGVYASLTALLAGYFFNYESQFSLLWLLVFFAVAALIFWDAYRNKQIYFILLASLYSYIGLSSLVIRVLTLMPNALWFYPISIYAIGSAVLLINYLIKLNKKLQA